MKYSKSFAHCAPAVPFAAGLLAAVLLASGSADAARFQKVGTIIDLPDGICDGNFDGVNYQQIRDGIAYEGTFKARNLIQCNANGGGVEGVFQERGYDAKTQRWNDCQGSIQLGITEEDMDAVFTVWGTSAGKVCDTVGRTYESGSLILQGGTRAGAFVSMANFATSELRGHKSYLLTSKMACFELADNGSQVMGQLPAGTTFQAAQGINGTLVHVDFNNSPYLETSAGGKRCFVRAARDYVTFIESTGQNPGQGTPGQGTPGQGGAQQGTVPPTQR